MAAGRTFVSASRESIVPRRTFRSPLFNEKEYFYHARVLRRMRKMAASAVRPVNTAVLVSTEDADALALRCYNLEWAAAVANYNVAQFQERLCRVEAAADWPPLPFSASRQEMQPDLQVAAPSLSSAETEEAAKPEESAVQPALLPVTRQSEESVSLVDAPAIVQSKQSRKKGQRQRRAAAAGTVADAGAAADARPAADDLAVADVPAAEAAHEEDAFVPEAFDASESQHGGLVQADAEPVAVGGAMASVSAAQPSIEEFANAPKQHDAAVPQHRRAIEAWAVVQGLQSATHSHHNGRLVRVGIQRVSGRFETVRAGTKEKLAVRPENLRWLLQSYEGRAVGDDLADEDDGYGELVLLGFDPVREQWACKHLLNREGGSARYRYRWARIKPPEVSLN